MVEYSEKAAEYPGKVVGYLRTLQVHRKRRRQPGKSCYVLGESRGGKSRRRLGKNGRVFQENYRVLRKSARVVEKSCRYSEADGKSGRVLIKSSGLRVLFYSGKAAGEPGEVVMYSGTIEEEKVAEDSGEVVEYSEKIAG